MAQGGKKATAGRKTVRHFTPDQARQLVEAGAAWHNQMAVAAADWQRAPPDDHTAGKWGRHAAAFKALVAVLQCFANVDAALSGESSPAQVRRRARPLFALIDELFDLKKGITGTLLKAGPGGGKAPTVAVWEGAARRNHCRG